MTRPLPRHRGRLKRAPIFAVAGVAAIGLAVPAVIAAAAVAAEPGVPDTTPPLLNTSIYAPSESGWHHGDPNYRAHAIERGGSEVDSISYSIDGGPVVIEHDDRIAIDMSAEGVHEIEIWTLDTAGNESFHQRHTVKVDTVAPTITLPAVTEFAVGEKAVFTYSCDDPTSGVKSCDADVPNKENLSTITPGEYLVRVVATDAAGHETNAEYRYTVIASDATPPAVELRLAPEPASGWYRSYLGAAVVASDPSGIASVHYAADGAVSTNGDVVGEPEATFDLTADGVTDITYWAIDGVGNQSEHRTSTVRIDTVVPRIDIASPALSNPLAESEFEVEQGEVVPLEFECIDAHSGIESCGVTDNGPAFAAPSALPTDELGEQRVKIVARDNAGNVTKTQIVYTVVEASGETPVEPGGTDGEGHDGAGEPAAPAAPASPTSAGDRGSALADTGFPLMPALMLAGGLVVAGGLGLTARSALRSKR
ncbi:hypothetical protein [Agromyces sp. H66]|uniref:hypothetical protein n=1 Tax=Agromyces sp. H66 TaxID=2529859 RepID=UPI0010AA1FBB|nr:hypothetical protein [Agromyces sp. H66]